MFNKNKEIEPFKSKKDLLKNKGVVLKIFGISLILILIVISAFWRSYENAFINMDDDVYVTDNERVKKGINLENIKWSFSTIYFGFYYPFTWLSHMLDSELYGLNAGGHHITSVIIHIINTLLLFFVLYRMTGKEWRSFIVAGLFAVHPLHVESVVWISERKDILSALFFFLGLLFYSYYVEKVTIGRYILVLVSYLFGLMSKPMVITFPFVLLLLDYWPLKRINLEEVKESKKKSETGKILWSLVKEKIPMFALIPLFSFLTFYAQKKAEAVVPLGNYNLIKRFTNAAISYFLYLKKMGFPDDLAAYYPIKRGGIDYGLLFVSMLVLSLITYYSLKYLKTKRYLAVGWLWYLGMLVPVIGIVRIGDQAMADRYTYIPLVGIFFAMVWIIGEVSENRVKVRMALSFMTSVLLLLLVFVTQFYVGLWKNEETLFNWALSKTKDNWFVHNNLGSFYFHNNRIEEGAMHIEKALSLNPNMATAHLNYGYYLAEKKEKYDEAIEHYRIAVELDPHLVKGWNNLGLALSRIGNIDEAIECFNKGKEVDPSFKGTYMNLGYAYSLKGYYDKAIETYKHLIEIDDDNEKSYNELGATLLDTGNYEEAIKYLQKAIELSPDFILARTNLALAFTKLGELEKAEKELRTIIRIKPDEVKAINDLGLLLMQSGRISEAKEKFEEGIKIAPDYENTYINLGVLMTEEKNYKKAAEYFKKAVEINPNSEIARSNLEKAENILNRQSGNESIR